MVFWSSAEVLAPWALGKLVILQHGHWLHPDNSLRKRWVLIRHYNTLCHQVGRPILRVLGSPEEESG